MTHGSVKILFYNENADSIVASAGRISTTKGCANEIYEKSCQRDKEENVRLIHKIISSGHTSVLEHAFLNLAFDNVSVFVEQFMIEFRLASFTVKSRRYVDFGNMGFVMPDWSRYGGKAGQMKKTYVRHIESLFVLYQDFLSRGIEKEDARFVLPYSFRSNFYCTVNARELMKIVREMVWGRGKEYPEILRLGQSLMEQCKKELPFLEIEESAETKEAYSFMALPERMAGADTEKDDGELAVLLHATDRPEEMICRAAVLSAGAVNWQRIDVTDVSVQREIIQNIFQRSRRRELEQAQFTVLFRKISLAGVTHLVRHRMQSIIIPDYRRACDYRQYIVPDSIVKAGLKEKYEHIFEKTAGVVRQLLSDGLTDCDKVYLLLSGMTVPVMTTMNANELFTFIRLRSCNRAQWEIADDAKALLNILRGRYPLLFSFYGPTCYMTGNCPEGKMSCGQMEKVIASFRMDAAAMHTNDKKGKEYFDSHGEPMETK